MEVKHRTAKSLVSKLSSVAEETRIQALCELRLLTKNDPEIRPIIADEGAIPYLSDTLYSPSAMAQENAAAALLNLSISSRESLISTDGLLDSLSHALRSPSTSPAAVQSSAAIIYSLLIDETNRPIIGSKRDIIYALVDVIKNPNSPGRSIKDAVKALFGVSLHPLNRSTVIELGAVPVLFALVLNDGRVGLVEDATAVIAQIAGCTLSVDAFRKVSGVSVLVDLIGPAVAGCGNRIQENAVSALLNLVRAGGDGIKEEVKGLMGSEAFAGISEVMAQGTPRGKGKAATLMNILGVVGAGTDRGGVNGEEYTHSGSGSGLLSSSSSDNGCSS
ncbi:hypothetical protein Dimus_018932 [Dionaea muscipula]